MDVALDVARYLDTGSTLLTVGTNVFAHLLPDSPNTAVAVYEAPSVAPEYVWGSTAPWVHHARVRIVARSTSVATARARADYCHTRLNVIGGVLASSTAGSGKTYLSVQPEGEPAGFGQDEAGRYAFQFAAACDWTP